MVDLGFMLITFFIFTATLSQPHITKLIMPQKGEPTTVAQSTSMTLLLDNEKAFAYEGLWEEAIAKHAVVETNYDLQTGLGARIRQKQKTLSAKNDLVVLIKPLTAASYQHVITALDEMQINNVKKYALVDATVDEISFARNN